MCAETVTPADGFVYGGGELAIFEQAVNWKRYFASVLQPYITGDVAEVGAGIGGTTSALWNAKVAHWLCVEPDPALAAVIERKVRGGEVPESCRVFCGRLAEVDNSTFDTIVYIDVIEHIEDDRRELAQAFRRLRSGGHLVVLVPAFGMLFSEFDRQVGHFRRYSVPQLVAAAPPDAVLVTAHYLDSVGFLLSLGNRLALKSKLPTRAQIGFWDKAVVPISRIADMALSRWIGRSAIAVWRRPS